MTADSRDPLRIAYFAWIAVCLVWGTTYLAIRVALETIPPATVGALRYVAAGAILAVIVKARGEKLPAISHWRGLAVLGFLMIAIGNGGVIWAEQWVPSGIAAVVVAASPFWMTGLEAGLGVLDDPGPVVAVHNGHGYLWVVRHVRHELPLVAYR